MPRWAIISLLVLLVLSAAGASRAEMEPRDSPPLAQFIAQGDAFVAAEHFDKALDAYRKADKLAKHTCATCDLRMFVVDLQLGDLSAALDDTKHAIAAATDDKPLAVRALGEHASLLAEMAGKPNDKKLKEAEMNLRESLTIAPAIVDTHFELGTVLLKQERDQEGIVELMTFTAMPGADSRAVALALREIAHPILAREPVAPDFSFVSFDGVKISSDALHGKIVLLDFWATWCEPCRESIPALIRLQSKYAGRPLEVVGISLDSDQQAWQKFIGEHHMEWPDHFDGGFRGEIARLFNVHAIPTYIVIDGEGTMLLRQSGYDTGTVSDLQSAIDKALKKLAAQPPAPVATSPAPN